MQAKHPHSHHPSFLHLLPPPVYSLLWTPSPHSCRHAHEAVNTALAQSHPSLALEATRSPSPQCWSPNSPLWPFRLAVSIPLSLCGLPQLNSSLKCSSFPVPGAPVSSISMVSTTKFSLENFSACHKREPLPGP